MSDLLPFKKPVKLARLERPSPEQRKQLFNEMLEFLAQAEQHPSVVGYALVALLDDGKRLSCSNVQKQARVQLARAMRRFTGELVSESREDW